MHVTAVIVNYRTPHLVLNCLEALSRERRFLPDLKAVVVDNASGDDSVPTLAAAIEETLLSEWVEFLPLPLNGGFGWGNNQAILHLLERKVKPEAFLLLNPDTVIEQGALCSLVACLTEQPKAGAVGSQLLNPDGSLAGSAFRFPTVAREFIRGVGIGRVGKILGVAPVLIPYGFKGFVDWVTGASVLLRTQALEESGLFDTGFFLYFEEVELMHRLAEHGWLAYHCPESRVIHVAGASTGVVDGKTAGNRVPPDYVFHSRRRYFALTGGKRTALVASVAWLAGDVMRRTITYATGNRGAEHTPESGALLRIGLRACDHDTVAAFERIGDKAGGPPSWMNG